MANNCIKRCSIPSVIREITQVMKYHCMYKTGYNFKEKKKRKGEGINSGKDLYKLETLNTFLVRMYIVVATVERVW